MGYMSSICAKHSNLPQLPGVCSSCLRERLDQLVASPDTAKPTTATRPNKLHILKSPSFSCSSNIMHADAPWSSAGVSRRRLGLGRHKRNGSHAASEVAASVLMGVRCGGGGVTGGGLKKSRSMATVSGMEEDEEEEEVKEEGVKVMKRGRGFWSKLIRFKSMRRSNDHLHHHPQQSAAGGREIFMY